MVRLAEPLAAALSKSLGQTLSLNALPCVQLPYRRYLASLRNPCVALLCGAPLQTQLSLDLPRYLGFALLESMLGNRSCENHIPSRPLSKIESRLLTHLIDLILGQFNAALRSACELQPNTSGPLPITVRLAQLQGELHAVYIVPPDELIVTAPLELRLQGIHGRITFCIPRPVLESLAIPRTAVPDNVQAAHVESHLRRAALSVRAVLAETTLSAADLATLSVGDIITTPKSTRSTVALSIDAAHKLKGYPLQSRGKKALRIAGT